ncbi:MAG TPA: VWA domain-containing protein [Lacunisphaera sp.]|jgi:prenyltransferase beta subunit
MKFCSLLFCLVVFTAYAGPFDDLKQAVRDKAQEKAQQAAEKKDAPSDTDADKTPPADNPAPGDGSAASVPDTPAPADVPADKDSTDTNAPAPADAPPPLPPASALTIELRSGDPKEDAAPPPALEFPSTTSTLFVRSNAQPGTDVHFFVRVVAPDVPGLPTGMVVALPSADLDAVFVEPEMETADMALSLPRAMLPGRYRVELYESDPPGRVITQQAFTIVAAKSPPGTAFNLADPELGGLLELATGEKGAGLTWSPQLLVPGNSLPWTPTPAAGASGEMADKPEMPCELVVSFYQRQPALVTSVEILSPAAENAPGKVEIWGSSQSATEGFARLAAATNDADATQFVVAVPPTQVEFLKIKILTAQDDTNQLALTGVRIREGEAAGYVALAQRFPDLALWRLQPKHAAQAGLFYLQASAVQFQTQKNCIGCHVQAQALRGLTIAKKNDYIVSETARGALVDYLLRCQYDAGNFARQPEHEAAEDTTTDLSTSMYAALGLAFGRENATADGKLMKAARWLAGLQLEDGSEPTSDERMPVTQGAILETSNAVDLWSEVLKAGDDPVLRHAFERGMAFIEKADIATTQDAVFQLLALEQHGDVAQKKRARQIAAQLQQQQQPDGGWKLEPETSDGSTPFSTGEVLYALRTTGMNIGSSSFQRGMRWLVAEQKSDGSWQTPQCSSNFSSTMWPVIALVGAFTAKAEPAHIIVMALPRRVPPPAPPPPPSVVASPSANGAPQNLEFILDCSGSMDSRLGRSDRITVAKEVLRAIIAKLPDISHVGLRLYGHRYSSFSSKSRTDTELVVPIGPLNRDAMLKAVDGARAHGETPLVYSTLQAGDDLKKIGGGTIVVVTDGEESCGGKPREAGPRLAALGVPVHLDIIGFTLSGARVTNDMIAFAQPTGGNFYTAADSAQLAAALNTVTLPVVRPAHPPTLAAPAAVTVAPPPPLDLSYEIFDHTGRQVVMTTTLSGENPDLEPGMYRVIVHDGAKAVVLENLTVKTSETVQLRYSPVTGLLQRVSEP